MPRMDGVELTRRAATDHPEVAVIILTTFDDDEYVLGGLRAGAKGYLLKNVSPEELVRTIEKWDRGEPVLGGPAASRVISELKRLGDTPRAGATTPKACSPKGRSRWSPSLARVPTTRR